MEPQREMTAAEKIQAKANRCMVEIGLRTFQRDLLQKEIEQEMAELHKLNKKMENLPKEERNEATINTETNGSAERNPEPEQTQGGETSTPPPSTALAG